MRINTNDNVTVRSRGKFCFNLLTSWCVRPMVFLSEYEFAASLVEGVILPDAQLTVPTREIPKLEHVTQNIHIITNFVVCSSDSNRNQQYTE